jgi:hypothetical protein
MVLVACDRVFYGAVIHLIDGGSRILWQQDRTDRRGGHPAFSHCMADLLKPENDISRGIEACDAGALVGAQIAGFDENYLHRRLGKTG